MTAAAARGRLWRWGRDEVAWARPALSDEYPELALGRGLGNQVGQKGLQFRSGAIGPREGPHQPRSDWRDQRLGVRPMQSLWPGRPPSTTNGERETSVRRCGSTRLGTSRRDSPCRCRSSLRGRRGGPPGGPREDGADRGRPPLPSALPCRDAVAVQPSGDLGETHFRGTLALDARNDLRRHCRPASRRIHTTRWHSRLLQAFLEVAPELARRNQASAPLRPHGRDCRHDPAIQRREADAEQLRRLLA